MEELFITENGDKILAGYGCEKCGKEKISLIFTNSYGDCGQEYCRDCLNELLDRLEKNEKIKE